MASVVSLTRCASSQFLSVRLARSGQQVPSLLGAAVPCRQKAKKAGKKNQGKVDDNLMEGMVNVEVLKKSMQTAVDALEWQYCKALTTRPTVALLDHVKVKMPEGGEKRLKDAAQISQRADNNFMINFPGRPELATPIESAIRQSGINLDPLPTLKTQLRIPLPKLTKEYRVSLETVAKQAAEKAKMGIRRVRNNAVDDVKKMDSVPKEDKLHCEKQIQLLMTLHNQKIDDLLAAKKKELFPK